MKTKLKYKPFTNNSETITGDKILTQYVLLPARLLHYQVADEILQDTIKFYKTNGKFENPVIIQGKRLLIEGYITFVAAKVLKLMYVPVIFVKKSEFFEGDICG